MSYKPKIVTLMNADMSTRSSPPSERTHEILITTGLAIGLTIWFWLDLWLGGGLIGGDVYSYYFPQKVYLSEWLRQGVFPLWNSYVGHGYPILGESQTGLLYPPNLLLYSLFEVNTAYNLSHLVHYVLAFMATYWLLREWSLSHFGACLGSLAFVYGWFPPRCCLEWAIITGAYLPLALAMLVRYQNTEHRGWLWGMSGVVSLQLLAGHYHLAFITALLLVGWLGGSLFFKRMKSLPPEEEPPSGEGLSRSRFSTAAPLLFLGLGFAIASAQLIPTWHLKQQSQRSGQKTQEFQAAEGHIPPRYFSQLIVPWMWYDSMEHLTSRLSVRSSWDTQAMTNPVEAHLYIGWLPMLLALAGGWFLIRRRSQDRRGFIVIGVLGLLFALLASGWPMSVLESVPGFSFFRGQGRYGIVTALALSAIAGYGWDHLTRSQKWWRLPLGIVVVAVTVVDLSLVSNVVTYAYMVPNSPLTEREESLVGKELRRVKEPVRLFAPGANLPTILGVAATPVYLGLGPSEYFNPKLTYPEAEGETNPNQLELSAAQLDWLRRAGVTHILSFNPPLPNDLNMELIWSGLDPLLNVAWARQEPIYLSELNRTRGRASVLEALAETHFQWKELQPNYLELNVMTPVENELILTELYDSDWVARIDGQVVETEILEGMYRKISLPEGNSSITWSYEPSSVWLGMLLSLASFTLWIGYGFFLSRNQNVHNSHES